MTTILVLTGGAFSSSWDPRLPDDVDLVVAADSGLETAVRFGLTVDHLVGDLDSVDPASVDGAAQAGTTVHRHERDKDATDFELALDLAAELVPRGPGLAELVVIGPGGGRLDHLLGDLGALAGPRLARFDVSAHLGEADLSVLRPQRPRTLPGRPGQQVSLLAMHGPVEGITTAGLRWPLLSARLEPGSTRGISNEFTDSWARVSIEAGALLVVQPGTAGGEIPVRTTPYDPHP